jgi:RNA polymerase sigma-70 factor (ECF subfamily)
MRLTPVPQTRRDTRPSAAGRRRPVNAEAVLLLRLAQAGDRDAFGELYTSYARPVRAYIAARTRDRDAVADLLQDTFVTALQDLDRAHDDVQGWLLQLAAKMCVRHARAQRRYLRAVLTTGEHHGSLAATTAPHCTEAGRRMIADALAGLDARERLTVQLRFLDGHGPQTTAQIMGCSRHTVRRLQSQALRQLTARLMATDTRTGHGRAAR